MARTGVVKNAKFGPGKCAISGDTKGPFLDTGQNVARYGRIYLSFKWLDEHLRTAGYLKEEDVADLKESFEQLSEENTELESKAETFDSLIEAISGYLPEQEPEVVEQPVVRHREPTDDEIEDWIKRKGANHPAVRAAQPYEAGSSEEWEALYGHRRERKPKTRKELKQEQITDNEAQDVQTADDGPSRFIELHEQTVDLDEVLAQSVKDVTAYAENKSDDFKLSLAKREHFLAKKNSRNVRKGVLLPLGYWDEDEDESIYPSDEGDEDDTTGDPDEDDELNIGEDE